MTKKKNAILICALIVSLAMFSVHIITSVSAAGDEPLYVGIANYYDNRKAVVTLTLDDPYHKAMSWSEAEKMYIMLDTKQLYYTIGSPTNPEASSSWLPPNWTQVQEWLNLGHLEMASHSRTHATVTGNPSYNYDSEIAGSKADIIGNLMLPPLFSFNGNEYVYEWLEPYSDSDSTVRQKLGSSRYLSDRTTWSGNNEWATWDSTNGLFNRYGYSIRMGTDSGSTDPVFLDSYFDTVYQNGEIYHLFAHPIYVDWNPGQYADLHLSHISGRTDVWYVGWGLLYLYHWTATRNVVQVTSTGEGLNKVFKINMSSTDRQNYGAKYPITYVFDIPSTWTTGYVDFRFQETAPWTTMETKTSSDFFNGINAVRFDYSNHKAYVSIGFDDISNEIYLQILPSDNQPTADFAASPTSGRSPLSVSFTDTSTSYDGIASWAWDFGDGQTSTEENPPHVYNEGVYTVSLTVVDTDGDSDTETKDNYITVGPSNQPPVADANGPYTGTEGAAINFVGSGSNDPDGSIVSYFWDFGDGENSTLQNPTHTYAQAGLYAVTLTVTDDDSATDTDTTTATIEDTNPNAEFQATPLSGAEPLTVSFLDLSNSYDGITTWEWDFENDGVVDSTEQNPVYTYAKEGVYTASLTVTENDGDSNIKTKSDYIIVDDSIPVASFTYSPTAPLEGDLVTFDASGSTGYDQPLSYSWDFGDGILLDDLTDPIVTHTYAQNENYMVTLTVKDADGSTDSASLTVAVGDKDPIPDFTALPTSGTEPLQVSFEDTSTSYDGITAWEWSFGDGHTSTDQNPTHTYVHDGTYTVTLTVYEGDGGNAVKIEEAYITVTDTSPSADFEALQTSEALTVSFTDTSTSYDDIISWAWDFGDGGASTDQNPTHKFPDNGVFNVKLTVTDADGSTDTITKQVSVMNTFPLAEANGPYTGTEGVAITFDGSGSYDLDGVIVSYLWDFGDGKTSSDQNPTHTYVHDGTYTVSLTVTDDDSATDTDTTTATVADTSPTAVFSVTPTRGPEPLTVRFTDLSSSYDGVATWKWDFNNDGIVDNTEQNPVYTYAKEGVYTVSLTVTENDGDSDIGFKSDYIIVDDSIPVASFTYSPAAPLEGDLVTFDASGSTGYDEPLSYSWDFGDGASGEGASPTHTYAQNGEYLVTLTVTDFDGSSDSTSQTITVADRAPAADFRATPTSGSEPLQVNFTDLSTSYDGITSWTWNFGDGETGIEQNPTHVYPADGFYTVTLTVVEGDGSYDVETKIQYITVTDTAPTADFSYLPNPEALTIDFSDQSTSYDELVSWTWNFGDGETNTEQNPTHKFPDDGTFDVSLTVMDADGSTDTITKQVSVLNVAPTADFNIVSSPKPTIDEDITFLDQSSDPDGFIKLWFWDLGDGTTSTSQNVTHRYNTIGTFIVNLTVTDDDGATDSISKSVTIYDVIAPVTIDNYDGLWHTSDFTINLTATDDLSGVQTTYYRINDGSIMSVQVDGQPFILVEGYNKLEYWSVDLAGNEETHRILMDVKLDKTNPTANAGPDQAVDEDTPMTFDGSASFDNINITSYTWTFFDGTPQTLIGTKPKYTFNAPGKYNVTLSVTDAALNSATDTVEITVIDITQPIANAGDDQVVHEDVTVTFDGSGSTDNVEIVSYVWTFIDVIPRTLLGVNFTYIFDIPSVYNVTLTVSDAQGNLATDVVTITVIDATWPAANAGPDQVVDEDTLVDFDGSASSDNVGIISYIWTFTDGTPQTMFGANPSYTFETPGVYKVSLNVTDAEGHFTTDTVAITVLDVTPPIVDTGNYAIVVENAPVNLDASGSHDNFAIVDYQWDFGDGKFENSTIPSAVHTYAIPGVYMVTLTVTDEAGNVNSTSISVVVYRDTDGDLIADHIDTDDDNDEMPDDWEILHGLNPLDPSDASLDSDGDGLNNLTEYQIGSDPHNYNSPSPFPLVGLLVIAMIGFIIFLGVFFMRKL